MPAVGQQEQVNYECSEHPLRFHSLEKWKSVLVAVVCKTAFARPHDLFVPLHGFWYVGHFRFSQSATQLSSSKLVTMQQVQRLLQLFIHPERQW